MLKNTFLNVEIDKSDNILKANKNVISSCCPKSGVGYIK